MSCFCRSLTMRRSNQILSIPSAIHASRSWASNVSGPYAKLFFPHGRALTDCGSMVGTSESHEPGHGDEHPRTEDSRNDAAPEPGRAGHDESEYESANNRSDHAYDHVDDQTVAPAFDGAGREPADNEANE